MKNRSLASQLIFFILSGASLIFLSAFTYNYGKSKEAVIRNVFESAHHLAHEKVNQMETILRGLEKVPLNLSVVVQDFSFKKPELLKLIKDVVETNHEVYGVAVAYEKYAFDPQKEYFCPYFFRKDGQVTYDPGSEGNPDYLYWYWDWYQIPQQLGRPMWSEPYFDEGSGNIIMSSFSVPTYRIVAGKKTFQGIVEADVSLTWLQDIVRKVKILQTGYAFLISPNGVFVTYPDEKFIMRRSIFSIAEERHDPRLRQIGRDMVRGGEGLVAIKDFTSGRDSWLYYAPLPANGWSLGVVFPNDELFAEMHSLMERTVAIVVLGLAFLALVIIIISRRITRPLRVLAVKTADIAHGDFSATVPETGAREIAHLARSFNRMGEHLAEYIEKRDFVRDTFGRYVTQEVVKRLLEDKDALELGGETREVSIVMSDLRGFTSITADMHPEQVVTFLNRYLGKMIEILTDNQAVIDEIVGDGILAFFGAPTPMADHPARAVACALQMQAAMDEINALNEADGLPYLEMGIAVNTGEVVVGNIGSERRTKYSVVGAHVNFTSRIEAFAVGGQVLISADTYERLRELVQVRGEVQGRMKGISGSFTLYDVQAIGEPYNVSLAARDQEMRTLVRPLEVRLDLLTDKIVAGTIDGAQIVELGEGAARVVLRGEVEQWQDVRLHLLAEDGVEIKGRIYGKVTAAEPREDGGLQVYIRFTSVSPEIHQVLRQAG